MTTSNQQLATDNQQPQSPDAERAVLGACLINNAAFFRVKPIVDAADFFKDAHRTLFRHIAKMASTGDPVEPLTLRESLIQAGEIDSVGGVSYISSLLDSVPDVANVERYARIVARAAKLRRLIATGNTIMRRAFDGEEEPEVIAADALAAVTPTATAEESQSKTLHAILIEEFTKAEKRFVNDEEAIVLRTSFETLNAHQVFRPTLVVVGSPSNHGKSSWLMNICSDIASHDQPTVLFTLESTQGEIAWRWMSKHTGIPHSRVTDWRQLATDDMRRLGIAQAESKKLPFFLARKLRTIDQLYGELRRLKSLTGLSCAAIDYFQLIKFPGGPRDREERLAEVAQRLLEYAIDLEITIICASQLNEERKSRAGGRLHQSDLKYAKAIGEAARVVLMFQRPQADDKANKELRSCEVLFQIEKHNEGRTGDYEWHFDEVTQRFGEGDCNENRCRHFSKADTATETLWKQ